MPKQDAKNKKKIQEEKVQREREKSRNGKIAKKRK
jgi:hypothetical protein